MKSRLFTAIVRVRALCCATALLIVPLIHAQRMELPDNSAEPVVVERADIKTEITGRIAVTTFDLVFRNPNQRVLEGTFVLPLLDGQSVVRFALDIDGALREAVPVDKTHGRVVFEEIERRRVDPGLLEQTAGNNYRARVFPLPARGTRRIVVACQEDIVRGATAATYRLNLDFPERLKSFRLALLAHAGGVAPTIRTTLGLDLPAWQPGHMMSIAREDFVARGLLEIEVPTLDRPHVLTGRWENEEYFYAEAPAAAASRPRPKPRVVGVLWDSSGSGHERDHEREFAALDAWFAELREVEVRLVRLRDEASAPTTFRVARGDWSALKSELAKTEYDGATSLDGLKDDPAVEEWLLFSDGLVNYGVTPGTAKLPLRGTIHAVLASPRADPVWLRSVAMRHRGEFVSLLELSPAAVATRLRSQSSRVLSVEYQHHEAAEIYPEPGTPIGDGPFVVTGVLRGQKAKVRIHIGPDASRARVVEIVVHSGDNASPLAARGWATTKIQQLSTNFAANRADIRETSRKFGIVTADTSLIVLETVADYVRYDIQPPAELMGEWTAQRRNIARDQRKERNQHLEAVAAAFAARVEWWEKSYSKKTPRGDERLKEHRLASRPARSVGGAPPVPAARGGPLPVRNGDNNNEEIVVLSPFEVSSDFGGGYAASSTLSGARSTLATRDQLALSHTRRRGHDGAESEPAPSATITLQRWTPDAGYLDRLARAEAHGAYAVYLEERIRHGAKPGFFLDVANFFFDRGDAALARRILSNLAELELEDVALLRVLAHRLAQAERPDLALPLFERVLALRSDEPQSRRDLALVCADLKQYQRAVDLLWEVVSQPWSDRFPDIELVALAELNAIAATCGETLDLSRVDRRLRRNLPVQTRVILTWDANDCDIDLWVTDPNDEKASYSNPLTYQGGRMSPDFTAGYGPEEFMLREAKPGTYRVDIEYFGDGRVSALGPVTAQVRLITDFGLSTQQEKRLTVRLDQRKQSLRIGTFEVPASKSRLHASSH